MILLHSFREAEELRFIKQLALGFFDGLHLGHRAVIQPQPGLTPDQCAVLTFQTHPVSVINPNQTPPLITGLPHKLHVLESWKLGALLLLPFSKSEAHESAADFLKQVEKHLPSLKILSIGEDFRFGKGRKGNIPLLQKWCDSRRIQLHVTPRVDLNNQKISSSLIRSAIQSGNLSLASEMLGRPFSLYGEVVHGDQRGRQIGFPTANLHTLDECHPPPGVYSGKTLLADGSSHPSAIHIGNRPSISPTVYSIESHLLHFNADLYGQHIHIQPAKKIRPTQKFQSLSQLQSALQQDISMCS